MASHGSGRAPAGVEPGTRLGRYVVLEALGSGSMGTVVAAFDPELDRKVAIKLVHAERGCELAALREAKSLARLKHPNVVAVYDAGTFDARTLGPAAGPLGRGAAVFLAMELLDGVTLRRWSATPRSIAEILDRYLEAGRGLAAAHAAGVVHRDFKPDNVIIAETAAGGVRVCVVDFGIALLADDVEATSLDVNGGESSMVAEASARMIGTPAYMAPEQVACSCVDARADQYSFCVALFEALAGVRPFGSDALLESKLGGTVVPRRQTARPLPSALRRVLERGLATEPRDRFADMPALIAAIERASRPRRRRLAIAAAALGVAVIGIARHSGPRRCEAPGSGLVGVWDDPARERLQAVFAASAPTDEAFASTARALDEWTVRWSAGAREACADFVAREASRVELELRLDCIDAARLHLRSTLDVLAAGDARVLVRALETVAVLPDVDRCRDVESLARGPEPPTEAVVAAVADARVRLGDLQALHAAGRYPLVLDGIDAVLADAEATGYEPIIAEVRLQKAMAEHQLALPHEASADANEAFRLAIANGADEVAVRSASALVGIERDAERWAEAERWAKTAQAYLHRIGDDPLLEATLRGSESLLAKERGHSRAALRLAERALELRRARLPEHHVRVAESWLNLAVMRSLVGDRAGMADAAERSLAIFEELLGPDHPRTLVAQSNVAIALFSAGEVTEAMAQMQHVVDSRMRTFGLRHPDTMDARSNHAAMAMQTGEYVESMRVLYEVLAYYEEVAPHQVHDLAGSHCNVALIEIEAGDPEIARRHADRAIEMLDVPGASRETLGHALLARAYVHAHSDRDAPARDDYRRGLALWVEARGEHDAGAIEARARLAVVEARLGEYDRAIDRIELALAEIESPSASALLRPEVLFAGARVLAPSDPSRARRLARRAQRELDALGAYRTRTRSELEAWLGVWGGEN